jgi:CubicO group peptidase (beta-lactamase class C family)
VPTCLRLALTWIVLACWTACASARPDEELTGAIRDMVKRRLAADLTPGMAVAVVLRWTPILAEGFGLANVEHQVGVTPETVFQSGSVGKQFTGALVMSLVERGRMRLDDSIRKYAPDAPQGWAPITIRHLLTHTSGIAGYDESTIDSRRDYTDQQLLQYAFALKPMWPPGSRWGYSDTGYVVLGIAATRASGRFYGDELREMIFRPAGMRTARIISEGDIIANRAAGHRVVDGKLKNQEWVSPSLNSTADGSVYVSLNDMLAWDAAIREQRVLSKASWSVALSPVKLTSGNFYPYGFGWEVQTLGDQTAIAHTGEWQGFRARYARWTKSDLAVIVLANSNQADVDAAVNDIVKAIDPVLLQPTRPEGKPDLAAALRLIKDVLEDARNAVLLPSRLPHVAEASFPRVAQGYRKLMEQAGPVQSVSIRTTYQLGDDQVYKAAVICEHKSLAVEIRLTPDGVMTALSVQVPEAR